MNIDLRLGDCLEVMKTIKDNSIDMILCDLPYGTTQCKWDVIIPFTKLWIEYNRVIKKNGCIALFGAEPFSSVLRMSNINNYKYDWVWDKKRCTGFLNAKKQPLRNTENISIFYEKQPTYNPQPYKKNTLGNMGDRKHKQYDGYGKFDKVENDNSNEFGYPRTIITEIPVMNNLSKDKSGYHPTQKPIALLEYLIKTYTNEGETVLDNTMGSGSTMVACVSTNRNGIGIEMNDEYFNIAKKRVEEKKEEKDNEPPTLFNAQT